jgi:hypothetical protein
MVRESEGCSQRLLGDGGLCVSFVCLERDRSVRSPWEWHRSGGQLGWETNTHGSCEEAGLVDEEGWLSND